MDEETIRLVGELFAGLQVPMSLPGSRFAFGTAYEAWERLHDHLKLLGWVSKEQVIEALRRRASAAEIEVLHQSEGRTLPGTPR